MRKKNKLGYKWILLLLAFSCGSRVHAQYTLQITNNKTGQSIEKAEVRNAIDNTLIGQSDINGLINVDLVKGAELVFIKTGFESTSVILGTENKIYIGLTPAVESVEEVVIVGYNSQKRREITGSVGSVKGGELIKQPVLTGTQAIQGKLAGVQITNFGSPGSAPTVRIRGTGSVIGGAEPLYVVDGIITDDIRNISTSVIVSIDVDRKSVV